jgi:hypothetical protein
MIGWVWRIVQLSGLLSLGSTFERWFGGDDENSNSSGIGKWFALFLAAAVIYVIYKTFYGAKKISSWFK